MVEIVKEHHLVLSLLDNDNAIGFASLKDYNTKITTETIFYVAKLQFTQHFTFSSRPKLVKKGTSTVIRAKMSGKAYQHLAERPSPNHEMLRQNVQDVQSPLLPAQNGAIALLFYYIFSFNAVVRGWLTRRHYKNIERVNVVPVEKSEDQTTSKPDSMIINLNYGEHNSMPSRSTLELMLEKVQELEDEEHGKGSLPPLPMRPVSRARLPSKLVKKGTSTVIRPKMSGKAYQHLAERPSPNHEMLKQNVQDVQSHLLPAQNGAIILLQSVVRGWLTRRHYKNIEKVNVVPVEKSEDQTTSKPDSMIINLNYGEHNSMPSRSTLELMLEKVQELEDEEHGKGSLPPLPMRPVSRARLPSKLVKKGTSTVIRAKMSGKAYQHLAERPSPNHEMLRQNVQDVQSHLLPAQNGAIILLQSVVRGWLTRRHYKNIEKVNVVPVEKSEDQTTSKSDSMIINLNYGEHNSMPSRSTLELMLEKVQELEDEEHGKGSLPPLPMRPVSRARLPSKLVKKGTSTVIRPKMSGKAYQHLAERPSPNHEMLRQNVQDVQSHLLPAQNGAIILLQSVVRGWLTRRHYKNIEKVNVVPVEKSEDQTTSKSDSMIINLNYGEHNSMPSRSTLELMLEKVQELEDEEHGKGSLPPLPMRPVSRARLPSKLVKKGTSTVIRAKMSGKAYQHLAERPSPNHEMLRQNVQDVQSHLLPAQNGAIILLQSVVRGWLTRRHYKNIEKVNVVPVEKSEDQTTSKSDSMIINLNYGEHNSMPSRSTLELMLEKVQELEDEEHGKGSLPPLPMRPVSRARLPSKLVKKGTSTVIRAKMSGKAYQHLAERPSPNHEMLRQNVQDVQSHLLPAQNGAIILLQSVVRGWLTRRHYKNIEKVNVVPVEKSEDQTTSKSDSMEWVEFPYSTVFELQRRVLTIEAALQERKEQNAELRNNLKQYEERWLQYDESMKSMEKMWQEQLISIQVTLADAAKKKVDTRRSLAQLLQDESPFNTIDSTTHPINHQNGELDDNDNGNYFQVKLGSHVSKKDVIEEFQKLESQYGAWEKEYSMKFEEAEARMENRPLLQKEKCNKRWWRKALTKLRKLSCL